jgi:radical SAM-linked protein
MRLRLQFEKTGPARFTSHKDVVRIFQRCFAAAGIPMSYSEGFHPHMKMSFAAPLKTGWESDAEFIDIRVEGVPGPLADRCNPHPPAGLQIRHVSILPDSAPKLASDISAATYDIEIHAEDIEGRLADANGGRAAALRERFERCAAEMSDGENALKVSDLSTTERDGCFGITYTSTMLAGRVVSPLNLIEETLGDPSEFNVPPKVRRLAQYVERDGELITPVNKGAFQKA